MSDRASVWLIWDKADGPALGTIAATYAGAAEKAPSAERMVESGQRIERATLIKGEVFNPGDIAELGSRIDGLRRHIGETDKLKAELAHCTTSRKVDAERERLSLTEKHRTFEENEALKRVLSAITKARTVRVARKLAQDALAPQGAKP